MENMECSFVISVYIYIYTFWAGVVGILYYNKYYFLWIRTGNVLHSAERNSGREKFK